VTTWTDDELARIGGAQELKIASRRDDGTLRSTRIVWVVRDGDDLYVRSVRGRDSPWFRGAGTRHEGRVEAGGVTRDVRLVELPVEADPVTHDRLDAAYRDKYRVYTRSTLDAITGDEARAATLQLLPS
jgi:hypothetical protein